MYASHSPRTRTVTARLHTVETTELGSIEKTTFRQAWQEYLVIRKPRKAQWYQTMFDRCISDWWDLQLTAITKDMVQKRHQELTSTAPIQANSVFKNMRTVYNFARIRFEDELNAYLINPVNRLSELRAWNKQKPRKNYVPLHRLGEWYQAVIQLPSVTTRDYLLVLLFTGLRRSEAAALLWSEVDLVGGFLTVLDTKNGSDHSLPLSDFLQTLLTERYSTRGSNPYVFPGSNGAAHYSSPYKAIESLRSQTGIVFTPHDLRRTFLAVAEDCGVDEYTRKRLLNHSFQDVTNKHYSVVNPERLRVAMQAISDRINELISKESGAPVPLPAYKPKRINQEQSEPVSPADNADVRITGANQIRVEAKILTVLASGGRTKKQFYKKIGACFQVNSKELDRILDGLVERGFIRRYRVEHFTHYELL